MGAQVSAFTQPVALLDQCELGARAKGAILRESAERFLDEMYALLIEEL